MASALLCASQVATLRSAVKLQQEQQFLIAKKLQELTGSKNIKLKPVLDTSLIAGVSPRAQRRSTPSRPPRSRRRACTTGLTPSPRLLTCRAPQFIVEYGSSQIDLSVRGQLEKVQDELSVSMAKTFA